MVRFEFCFVDDECVLGVVEFYSVFFSFLFGIWFVVDISFDDFVFVFKFIFEFVFEFVYFVGFVIVDVYSIGVVVVFEGVGVVFVGSVFGYFEGVFWLGSDI